MSEDYSEMLNDMNDKLITHQDVICICSDSTDAYSYLFGDHNEISYSIADAMQGDDDLTKIIIEAVNIFVMRNNYSLN